MHGLINRSLENFLKSIYGHELWQQVVEELDADFDSFEPMFSYDDGLTQAVIDIAANNLGKPPDALLEDFGTFLVAHPSSARVRRLLRFAGSDYGDFLHSLSDLRGRARLAVPDLDLPILELSEREHGEFVLTCTAEQPGFGPVLVGILRAMADDYGALVFIEELGRKGDTDTLVVRLLDAEFSDGQDFSLALEVG